MADLSNKTYVVTGSTQGIGFAIANAIINAGGNVVIHGHKHTDAGKVASKLGDKAIGLGFDLVDSVNTKVLIDTAVEKFGALLTFIRNLAQQWTGEKVRVNQLNVGYICPVIPVTKGKNR